MCHVYEPNNLHTPSVLVMGGQWSKQIQRQKAVIAEKKQLKKLQERFGYEYQERDYHPN